MSGEAKKDIAFELDVDKLLAYFVIGCNVISKDGVFFNGGIIDYDSSAKPGSKTKMKFDFKGPSSTYEICYMPNQSGSKEGIQLDIGKSYDYIDVTQKDTKASVEADSKITTSQDDLQKETDKKKQATIKEFNQTVTKTVKDYEIKYRDGTAFNMLKAYLENFAGKDNAAKLKKTDIEICYLPKEYFGGPSSSELKQYKDFKIQTVKNKIDLAKARYNEWRDSGTTKVTLRGLAFKIKVTMTILTK